MTPYQRGNRDGLTNAAAILEAQAAHHSARADRAKMPSRGSAAETLQIFDATHANALTGAAGQLRRLAEAMPDDPEPKP